MPRALLINASPKRGRSTSLSMAEYLAERLSEKGIEARVLHMGHDPAGAVDAIDAADVVVLASPLYVDSLPSGVMAFFEEFSTRKGSAQGQRFLGIVNCGFPEASQCATAITIMSIFARNVGFAWAGALPMGMGEAVAGRPLREAGGMARRPRAALDLTAQALAEGKDVPEEALRLMARPPIPRWLFVRLAHRMWRQRARENGCADDLGAAPLK
jgi:multimeric flavodoxin WrbA